MKTVSIFTEGKFNDLGMGRLLVHESEYCKILNFNLKAGQQVPVHSHGVEGEVAITVLSGAGEFLDGENAVAATQGDILVTGIADPHGYRATADTRLLVVITPPI